MITSKILVINPNPTKTKIAIYKSTKLVFLKTIKHKKEELEQFKELFDQVDFRSKLILDELDDNDISLELIHIIVSIGGLIKPLVSGVYSINERMENDLRDGVLGKHANNLGGLIANNLLKNLTYAKAYIADPSVVDELDDVSRVSGHPLFERKSIFHKNIPELIYFGLAPSFNVGESSQPVG